MTTIKQTSLIARLKSEAINGTPAMVADVIELGELMNHNEQAGIKREAKLEARIAKLEAMLAPFTSAIVIS